jgi:molybdopterin biosynthesis enzyme
MKSAPEISSADVIFSLGGSSVALIFFVSDGIPSEGDAVRFEGSSLLPQREGALTFYDENTVSLGPGR